METDQNIPHTFTTIEIPNTKYAAVIEYSHRADRLKETILKQNVGVGTGTSYPVATWGITNRLPAERELLIRDNNIIAPLIATKRNVILGSEIYFYKKVFRDGMMHKEIVDPSKTPETMQDFFAMLKENDYWAEAANELCMHDNIFTESIATRGGRLVSMKVLRCRDTRARIKHHNGKVPGYVFSDDWAQTKVDAVHIPAYDPAKRQTKYMVHTGDSMLNDGYYNIPIYWGGREWIILSNMVPRFHLANLRNGYTIRYHIEIPRDYFKDFGSNMQEAYDPDKQKAEETKARADLEDRMRKFLAGVDNAGSTFISTYDIDKQFGKDYPGVKIKPLKIELNDESMLKLFAASNQANISAQGIHPVLANIESQGKLSSGSEMRNAYNIYVALNAPILRSYLKKAAEKGWKMNGWPQDIYFDFSNLEITKLDDNPAGKQEKQTAQPEAAG